MRLIRATAKLRVAILGIVAIVATALTLPQISIPASAQQAADRPATDGPPMDALQKADKIYQLKKAALSGAERGREIFYYKCWFCHNEFTQGVPKLEGLFQHPTLWSGQPVNDDTVKNQIRNGSADMAAYKDTLSEADLNDLVAFLREKCCWNSDAPPLNPAYRANFAPGPAQGSNRLSGGPHGIVKSADGNLLEGMMVQLIAKTNAIRTTVFTDADGRYEFPKLEAGAYTLHIAQPREFFPYAHDGVAIDGANALPDIVLTRIAKSDVLPPYPEIAAQMTGSEWLMSLSGSGADKRLLTVNCNWCHSYQQIFRNHYDERSWSKILYRMIHGAGSPLININPRGRFSPADEARLAHWLASVRGPGSPDPAFIALPRPQGRATQVVITEYELPRLETATHDVSGDADGNIWYSTHRSSYVGRLDPRTGKVTEFHVPPVQPGALPGTHWIHVDKNGIVWGSENWAHNIWRLDPRSGDFRRIPWRVKEPLNSPMGGNYALDPDGFIWKVRDGKVSKVDAQTGAEVLGIITKKFPGTYGSAISADGRYFGGGAWPRDGVVIADTKSGEVWEPDTSVNSGPARGEFDLHDNYWAGGRGGELIEFNMAEKRIHEFPLPTPYASMYTAQADKNGEVWGGEMHSGRYFRFDPKTEHFTEYVLPEPYGIDRESWIDNSTDPVTVWYVDHEGWITRIQPRD
jgi:virginiamycin B lyase